MIARSSTQYPPCIRCHQWCLRIRTCNVTVCYGGGKLNCASWPLGNKSIQPNPSDWSLALFHKGVLPEYAHLPRDRRPSELDFLSESTYSRPSSLLYTPLLRASHGASSWVVCKDVIEADQRHALTIQQRHQLQHRPQRISGCADSSWTP